MVKRYRKRKVSKGRRAKKARAPSKKALARKRAKVLLLGLKEAISDADDDSEE